MDRPPNRPAARDNRSLGSLFAELTQDIGTLLRQEVALARAEATQKAASLGRDIGLLVTGAAVVYAGLLAVVAAVVMLLARAGIPAWLAALLCGLVVVGAGAFAMLQGLQQLKRLDPMPRVTLQTLEGDAGSGAAQTS